MREKRKERGQPWRRARATFGLAVALVWLLGQGVGLGAVGKEFLIAPGPVVSYPPAVAHDPANQGFLVVWESWSESGDPNVYGRRVGSDGSLLGARFQILSNASCGARCAVAYDATHRRFLVASTTWSTNALRDILGQLIEADGTLFGPPFSLLTMGEEAIFSGASATYDPVKERFLVVWSDGFAGVLYGRQVNADGTLFPDREQPIASRPLEWSPSVAYDPVNRRFLVVWTYRDRSVCSSSPDLHGLLMADLPVEGGRLGVSPKRLSFSRAQVGSTKSRSLVLKNGGQGGLYGSVRMLDGPFEVISGGGDFTLEPGESKTVTTQFAPTDSGKVTSVLEITSTDPKRMSIQVQIGGTVK